jgi:hypothetical protein
MATAIATTARTYTQPIGERNGQVHFKTRKHLSHQAPVYGAGPGKCLVWPGFPHRSQTPQKPSAYPRRAVAAGFVSQSPQ